MFIKHIKTNFTVNVSPDTIHRRIGECNEINSQNMCRKMLIKENRKVARMYQTHYKVHVGLELTTTYLKHTALFNDEKEVECGWH